MRVLWPKEHGVYVQVVLPILTALCVGPTLPGTLIGTSVISGFLLHEPLLILRGGRGRRALSEVGAEAKLQATFLFITGAATGLSGFILSPLPARIALLTLFAFSGATLLVARRFGEKALCTELAVAITFSSAFVPIALIEAGEYGPTFTVAWIWAAVFGLQTLTIHAVKSRRPLLPHLTSVLSAVFVIGSSAGAQLVTPLLAGLLPPSLVTAAIMIYRVKPRQLKRIGWSFMCVDTCAWLVFLWLWNP